ncbi:Methyltransferase type 12 [Parvibaculum lavamentivorans DS-1]|uniref:Methyltransferase type 12 n=1 Tax=Parvibaculum lavamentivorans (strain DS-1 / DSM 13023 / NCIMB 13966) TaxID=402881 RepID=A7HTJ0_PARL1|nr:class I SAM-dependent methyltransferase [Parvibaculum lavamentivorans]ABS63223.1 Methyltransferase type 12 [Parvibaculum lavamentivorans DS-1]
MSADHPDDPLALNLARWEEQVDIHVGSDFYRVKEFLAGETSLDPLVAGELGDVTGKKLLHLQCHFGLDTLSLARMGAIATGLDFSPKAIVAARKLAADAGLDARFINARVDEAAEAAGTGYDIVFSSWGVLMWLPDLEVWARNIASCLKPGGFFYLAEGHPLLWALDDEGNSVEENLRIVRSYFLEGPQQWENAHDYAEPGVTLAHFRSSEWQHTLGEVISVLAAADLHIEFLHEHDVLPWPGVPSMERVDRFYFKAPDGAARLPLSYSVKARKVQ